MKRPALFMPLKHCPRCHGPLDRVKRNRYDHWIAALIPVKRFQCEVPSCRWSGLMARQDTWRTIRMVMRLIPWFLAATVIAVFVALRVGETNDFEHSTGGVNRRSP